MKRVLCAALLGAAALATPASAAPRIGVQPYVHTDDGVSAGFLYTTNGYGWESGLGARVSTSRLQACAGFGDQMPLCTPLVETDG